MKCYFFYFFDALKNELFIYYNGRNMHRHIKYTDIELNVAMKSNPGYMITKNGTVTNVKTGKVILADIHGRLTICNNKGVPTEYNIKNLIAENFIPNIFQFTEVLYINGNKLDNRVTNLMYAPKFTECIAYNHTWSYWELSIPFPQTRYYAGMFKTYEQAMTTLVSLLHKLRQIKDPIEFNKSLRNHCHKWHVLNL